MNQLSKHIYCLIERHFFKNVSFNNIVILINNLMLGYIYLFAGLNLVFVAFYYIKSKFSLKKQPLYVCNT